MAGPNTRNERAAVVGLARITRTVFPNPSVGGSQAERQQTGVSYPGILAGALTGSGRQITGLLANRATFTLQAGG